MQSQNYKKTFNLENMKQGSYARWVSHTGYLVYGNYNARMQLKEETDTTIIPKEQ